MSRDSPRIWCGKPVNVCGVNELEMLTLANVLLDNLIRLLHSSPSLRSSLPSRLSKRGVCFLLFLMVCGATVPGGGRRRTCTCTDTHGRLCKAEDRKGFYLTVMKICLLRFQCISCSSQSRIPVWALQLYIFCIWHWFTIWSLHKRLEQN